MQCHLSAGIGAAQISTTIHRLCIGVHCLYDIRSLVVFFLLLDVSFFHRAEEGLRRVKAKSEKGCVKLVWAFHR